MLKNNELVVDPSSRGVIIYGLDAKKNLEKAYDVAINYMAVDDVLKEHIFANTYPNFVRISKKLEKSEISVDETREVLGFFAQKPTLLGRRSVVIEAADRMSLNASNSLLKLLEKIPIDSTILMTTGNLSSLLPTIRSRCLKIHVRKQLSNIFEYSDVEKYLIDSFPEIGVEHVRKILDLVKSDYGNIIAFAKQNADRAVDFFNILSAYYVYSAVSNEDYAAANKVLKLQDMSYYLKTTFPDPQNAMIAAAICQ
jgi:DNA polymerase III delta prime subunit